MPNHSCSFCNAGCVLNTLHKHTVVYSRLGNHCHRGGYLSLTSTLTIQIPIGSGFKGRFSRTLTYLMSGSHLEQRSTRAMRDNGIWGSIYQQRVVMGSKSSTHAFPGLLLSLYINSYVLYREVHVLLTKIFGKIKSS